MQNVETALRDNPNATPLTIFNAGLFQIFGPSGLNILRHDVAGGGSVPSTSASDIIVTQGQDSDSQGNPVPNTNFIQWDMHLGQQYTINVPFALGVDLPSALQGLGFQLGANGGVQIQFSWDFHLGFGISSSQGFFLVTGSNAPVTPAYTGPELVFNATVSATAAGLNVDATLGSLQVHVTDGTVTSDGTELFSPPQYSSLTVTGSVDLIDPSYDPSAFNPNQQSTWNRLVFSAIPQGANLAQYYQVAIQAQGGLHFHVTTDASSLLPANLGFLGQALAPPNLAFDFNLTAHATVTQVPGTTNFTVFQHLDNLSFDNITLDVSGLLGSLVKPVANVLGQVLGPITDIIGSGAGTVDGFLNAPLPLVSTLVGHSVSLVDLTGGADGPLGAIEDLVNGIAGIAQFAKSVSNFLSSYSGGPIPIGSYVYIESLNKFSLRDFLNGFQIQLPTLQLPSLTLPSLQLPDLQLPAFELPNGTWFQPPAIPLPAIPLPAIQLPNLTLPNITLDDLLSDNLPNLNLSLTLPTIQLPSLQLPAINVPGYGMIQLPSIELGTLTLPSLQLPSFSIPLPDYTTFDPSDPIMFPAISLPTLTLPSLQLPNLALPAISLTLGLTNITLQLPTITPPSLSLPNLSLPSLQVPTFTVPDLSLPNLFLDGLPTISLPSLTLPTVQLPTIQLPSITLPPFQLPDGSWYGPVTIQLPSIQLPSISLGSYQLPSISLGELLMGQLPDITLPSIQLPSIQLPSIQLPSIQLPDLSWLQLPSIQLPSITLPTIQLPTISLADFSLPDLSQLNLSLPISLPDITLPSITLPTFQLPSIQLPQITLNLPNLPVIQLPSINLPAIGISLPSLPSLPVLPFTLPDLSLPQLNFSSLGSSFSQVTNGGFKLDLFDPQNIVKMLLGQPFNIMEYDLPSVTIADSKNFNLSFSTAGVGITGSLSAAFNVNVFPTGVVYDSTGLSEIVAAFRAGNTVDWNDLLDGFYMPVPMNGNPLLDVHLNFAGSASANIGVASASLDAALNGDLYLDIQGTDNTGQLRLSDIMALTDNLSEPQNLLNIFDAGVSINASLNASGLDRHRARGHQLQPVEHRHLAQHQLQHRPVQRLLAISRPVEPDAAAAAGHRGGSQWPERTAAEHRALRHGPRRRHLARRPQRRQHHRHRRQRQPHRLGLRHQRELYRHLRLHPGLGRDRRRPDRLLGCLRR